jgi:hypothetical protein
MTRPPSIVKPLLLPFCLQVLRSLNRGASAEQVGVTISIVHASHRGPHLLLPEPRQGISSLLTSVRAVPLGGQKVFLRVGGVCEKVVLAGNLARLNVGNLLSDLDESIAETVKLSAGLGFCGLDHEGS